jgi:hypothetical protein
VAQASPAALTCPRVARDPIAPDIFTRSRHQRSGLQFLNGPCVSTSRHDRLPLSATDRPPRRHLNDGARAGWRASAPITEREKSSDRQLARRPTRPRQWPIRSRRRKSILREQYPTKFVDRAWHWVDTRPWVRIKPFLSPSIPSIETMSPQKAPRFESTGFSRERSCRAIDAAFDQRDSCPLRRHRGAEGGCAWSRQCFRSRSGDQRRGSWQPVLPRDE